MGTLPQTRYLLTNYGMVIGEFDSLTDMSYHFGISVSDCGRVTFNGAQVNPTYGMGGIGGFTSKYAVIKDWSNNYLQKNLGSSYKVYRFLT
jgi:hypothetical protein